MITLYSTNSCPKCKILESKLKINNIEHKKITDEDFILQKGFLTVPVLEVDGKILDFASAVKWLNERK